MEMDTVATVVLCSLCCGFNIYMYSVMYIELVFYVIFISIVLSCMWCVYYPSVFCCSDSVS